MKIGSKLMLWGLTASLVPLGIATVISLRQGRLAERVGTAETSHLASEDLRHIVQGISSAVAAQQDLLTQKLRGDLNAAHAVIRMEGGISVDSSITQWRVRGTASQSDKTIALPTFKIGARLVSPVSDSKVQVPVVDEVKSMVGAVCTIFQKINDEGDMLRVLTNVRDNEGNRAIGTVILARAASGPNPIVQSMLRGERFVGRAYVVNGWYAAAYDPIKDDQGKLIGMLFAGVPEQSSTKLHSEIVKTKVGQTGYAFVLDSSGSYVISKDGKRDGEKIWDARDATGRLFIQDLVQNALKLQDGEVGRIKYPWVNDAGKAELKEVCYVYFKPWDWIIGAGSYESEFNRAVNAIHSSNVSSMRLLGVTISLCVVGTLVLWIWLSRGISRPVMSVTGVLASGSEQTSAAASQVAAASQSLAEGASEQAASLEETSSSLEELSSMTRRNAETSAKLQSLGAESRAAGDQGVREMAQMSAAMTAIKDASDGVSKITNPSTRLLSRQIFWR